jgi:hypothetical protein
MLAPRRCDEAARQRRGSDEAARPPSSVRLSVVEEKSVGGLGKESERRGWAVRGSNGACYETTRHLALLPQACRRSHALRPPEAGPMETLDSEVSPGLCGDCFDACAGRENEGAQKSNQQPHGSPRPGSTLRRLPNAPHIYMQLWMHTRFL